VRTPKPKSILIGSLLVLIAAAIVLWLAGTLLSAPANQAIGNLPADLKGRDVQFPSESGAMIRGWFVPGQKGSGAVVLMHGVRASRLDKKTTDKQVKARLRGKVERRQRTAP